MRVVAVPLLVLVALIAPACTRRSPDSDSPTRRDSSSDSDSVPVDTDTGTPVLPDPGLAATGSAWRVVEIPSDELDVLYAVVFYPPDPSVNAYDDGAPIVVTANPSFTVDEGFVDSPRSFFDDVYGVVEIAPVYPGWTVGEAFSTGPPDSGGLGSAAAIHDAVRFAAGLTTTPEGWTVEDITGHAVRHDAILLSALSSGGTTAMAALDVYSDDLPGLLVGYSAYETPTLPQLLTGDTGNVWMDPDPLVDDDGDGVTWDDGRNRGVGDPPCSASECDIALDNLVWTDDVALGQVWMQYDPTQMGVLYLDNNHNGTLDYDAVKGGTDTDGNGVIDGDEDFVMVPMDDEYAVPGQITWYYSEQTLAAAVEDGAFPTWPDTVADQDATAAFWADRNQMIRTSRITAAYPDSFAAEITYTEVDHGSALPERPHLTMLRDALTDGGLSVRYNVERDVAECLIDNTLLGDWAGAPPRGTAIATEDLATYAFPEDFVDGVSIGAGALGVFFDTTGPFDLCPF